MLQRQIVLKQLQELQRRGQLQELGDARNQNYMNPLSPLKQASGGQFLDPSKMLMVGNMQMMQHGGSGVFPSSPDGLVNSQSQNLGVGHVGMSDPQLGMYLYGTPAPNSDKKLNSYPYLQGTSTNLLSKNNNISLGMPSLHLSTFGNAFMSQQCDFSSDQINGPDGSSLTNQLFQEKNLFQQIPVQCINRGNLAGSYTEQGNAAPSNASTLETEGRCEDAGWHGHSTIKSSNLGPSSLDLDPLEQKILYDTNCWESSLSRSSNIGTGGFTVENNSYMDALSSTQSGSWSALMQSAVAETSSSDTGMDEEWSGFSFQNPGPSADNQPSNFFDSEKQHNNWVDRNSPNVFSPSFKPENLNQNSDRNCSYPGVQQSDHQHLRQQVGFHNESSDTNNRISSTYTSQLADYSSQLQHLTGVSHMTQTSLPSSNIWPGQQKECMTSDEHQSHILLHTNDNQANNDFSGQDLRGTSWLDESASYPVYVGVQKPFDDVNQLNIPSYTESEKMVPGHDVEPISAFLSSPGFHGESETAQSENMLDLLHKDDISDDHTPGVLLNSKVSNPNELPLTKTSAVTFSIPCNMAPISQGFDFRLCPTAPWTTQLCFPSLSMGNSITTSSSVRSAKDDVNFVPQLGAYFTGDDKGSTLSPEVQGHLLGKASSSTCHQNLQQMEAFGENGTQRQSIGSNEASCATYGSQISLQMAPTWFKRYGTIKNEQKLLVCDPNTAFNVRKPLTGVTLGNLQESSLMMQANSATPRQGTVVWPSTDINLIARKQLPSPIVLPSDVIHQNLSVSMPKKRKIVAFDMVPWHKEVNHEQARLQDISTAELKWSQASNRRQEEATNDVEIVEDAFPLVLAKRRLIFTTRLMQKVFKPAPAAILCADANSNYDCVVYSAARLALGDACNLIGQLPSETDVVSPDQLKTPKKTNGCGFSKVVEGLICRVNKLDGDLSRLQKTPLIADIKVENQELEKISIINRFAKFHIKAQSSTIDPATSSSKSIVQKTNIQRYVMALPMPRTVSEGVYCLSL